MSLVIAITNGKTTVMGGDSYCGTDEYNELCLEPKIYQVGHLGVGIAGNIRSENVLYQLLHNMQNITEDWLVNNFPNKFREALRKQGALKEESGISYCPDNSQYIFSLKNKLYYLHDDFSLWSPGRNFAAIGAARLPALGALALGVKRGTKDLLRFTKEVLTIGGELSPHCSPPYRVLELS